MLTYNPSPVEDPPTTDVASVHTALNVSHGDFLTGIRNTLIASLITTGIWLAMASSENPETQRASSGILFLGTMATAGFGGDALRRLGDHQRRQLAILTNVISGGGNGESETIG